MHLTPRGVDALTTFIAGTVERVLAGENVSPSAAPWTVLVPGAEGETVVAVQEALLAADIELAGGADGVFGNDTMAAVAEYQRRSGTLQVIGAVDVATARALGVYEDSEGADEATSTTVSPTTIAPSTVPAPAQAAAAGDTTESSTSHSGGLSVPVITALAVVALAAVLVGRRRYVGRQAVGATLGARSPGDVAASVRRRHAADGRTTGDVGYGESHLRPPVGAPLT